jgi:hypothetical protein
VAVGNHVIIYDATYRRWGSAMEIDDGALLSGEA